MHAAAPANENVPAAHGVHDVSLEHWECEVRRNGPPASNVKVCHVPLYEPAGQYVDTSHVDELSESWQ